MTEVLFATRDDEADLMALCRELHEDNGLFSFDDSAVREMLYRAFNREGGIVGIIRDGNKIAACISIIISRFWYSQDNHLEELFAFVRPEFRKSTYAQDLLLFAKRCSDQIGIPLVIGVLTNNRMESKVRLYRRKLGVPAGAFFVHGTKWQNDSTFGAELWRVHHRKRKETGDLNGNRAKISA